MGSKTGRGEKKEKKEESLNVLKSTSLAKKDKKSVGFHASTG